MGRRARVRHLETLMLEGEEVSGQGSSALCARGCAVLSTYMANGDAVGEFGYETPARQRPPQPPCGLLGAKLLLSGPRGQPKASGHACGASGG